MFTLQSAFGFVSLYDYSFPTWQQRPCLIYTAYGFSFQDKWTYKALESENPYMTVYIAHIFKKESAQDWRCERCFDFVSVNVSR